MSQFGINHWYWLLNGYSLETLLKVYQVLLAHTNLLICIERLQTYSYAVHRSCYSHSTYGGN